MPASIKVIKYAGIEYKKKQKLLQLGKVSEKRYFKIFCLLAFVLLQTNFQNIKCRKLRLAV